MKLIARKWGSRFTDELTRHAVTQGRSSMGLLIKGGEIVTADTRTRGDIFIEDETISAIGRD